ncbi:unnamed protein product [Rotaria socialis]|uniref:Diacylglycerol kinase n=1 Tax=Rotaria socialis TaxID=392032 RepID=A0A817V9E0_9BILA|nr:unnamed protein product [Rotaria socialis]CAF3341616.1 unnamed protein product [Rotaria socialis]CAF3519181.1 unnamed protein product [Rotaria socialis]CAF4104241.1 unnamed protein product [Rotaria socialis]CAF4177619.1 unnamed protein product [Rotaria socialis]
MAESTPPTISRTQHRVEYTPCIDTTVASSTSKKTRGNMNPHSSFDLISETREYDTSIAKNCDRHTQSHRILERDLRRLDIESDQFSIEMKNKKLARTESISLPTTPVEHMCSTFNQKSHNLTATSVINHEHDGYVNDDDDDDDNNDDAIQHFCFTSSKNSKLTSSEQITNESISNIKSFQQSTEYSSSKSSSSELSVPISFGVDWTEQAHPLSHCWFPYTLTDPSSAPSCYFLSCQNPRPTLVLSLVQCESCLIVVHTHHLSNLRTTKSNITNCMPPCRPSFCDDHEPDEQHKRDRHFWLNTIVLAKPCAFCKRKSMSSSLFNNTRASTMPTLDLMPKSITNSKSPVPGSPQLSGPTGGLQCVWCSRGYHRQCWEHISNQDDKNKCDYGIFRNIIVRPQWIRRISNSSPNFRAQFPSNHEKHSIYTPILLFINKRSGGQSGEKIYRKLLRLLNPRQVFLLENDQTIINALEIYSSLENIRICVFGGDGTVGWVLGRLAELFPSLNNPPVCICPLGTGNDLSRVLSWGEQYDPKRLLSTLTQIPQAKPIALDRWQVAMEQVDLTKSNFNLNSGRTFLSFIAHPKFIRDTQRASYQNHRTLPNTRFINYMSFGLDAAIALEFHDRRSRDPAKFSSPLKNKLMYLNESRKYLNDFARSKMWSLSSYIRLICDGENLTDCIKNCHTLLVLNIPGYASGTNPWGKSSHNSSSSSSSSITIQKDSDSFDQISTSSVELTDLPANTHEVYELVTLSDCPNDQNNSTPCTTTNNSPSRFERQDFGDRRIEVVGLSTTHMATIHIGFRGMRIAQCSQLRIELCCPMTAQMDGEPFYLPESVAINITHAGQVLVLRNENR